MNNGLSMRRFVFIAFIISLALCFLLAGCHSVVDDTTTSTEYEHYCTTTTESEGDTSTTEEEDESTTEEESTTKEDETTVDDEENTVPPPYYTATVSKGDHINATPYVGESTVSSELEGVYYTTDAPGGEPKNDETGKIWLKLTPVEKYTVSYVDISGEYSEMESLGNDIYCIKGVKSNLTVNVVERILYDTSKELFDNYGYGISDKGVMTVSWRQSAEEPIRYVEISYTGNDGYKVEYLDAALGKAELFEMTEDKSYTVSLRAVGYNNVGKRIDIEGRYMTKPKEVSFPRIEITTENYILPTFDNANKPSNAMGAGITNAFYEQCIMTMYNKDNEVIYSSTTDMGEGEEYLGAKIKIRGNTSAAHADKGRYPYKVKLDKKFDLLAPLIGREEGKFYEDKDWLLLNYGEELYRVCGDAVADAVGTEWSPDYCYVSLYVNGDYRGLYVLSEAVEKGSGSGSAQWRVPVNDDGYVFECDAYWWNEELYFDTPMTKNTRMYYTFKYPDAELLKADSPEVLYLKNYIISFENALKKNDDSYLEYIDLDSFAKWLLVSDYLCISDGGGCNIFLYKWDATDASKIQIGPNWDFDSYMGNVNGLSTIRMYWNTAPFYYHQLIKKDSFQNKYKELYAQTKDDLSGYIDEAFSKINIESHNKLLEYQNSRFGTSGKTLTEQKEKFDTWLNNHIDYMDTQFS